LRAVIPEKWLSKEVAGYAVEGWYLELQPSSVVTFAIDSD